MTQAMTKKTTNWIPAVRHKRSQFGVLMRVSFLPFQVTHLAERSERCAELLGEQLRLFPCREVAALFGKDGAGNDVGPHRRALSMWSAPSLVASSGVLPRSRATM